MSNKTTRSGWVCWWKDGAGHLMCILPSTCDYTRTGSIALFDTGVIHAAPYKKARRDGRVICLPVYS